MKIKSKRLLSALLVATMVFCLSAAIPLFANAFEMPTLVPIIPKYEPQIDNTHLIFERISEQPQNTSVLGSGTKSLYVGVKLSHTVSYQWQCIYNNTWVNLSDGTNDDIRFSYCGTKTSTLQVTGSSPGIVQLRCIVTFSCGNKITSDQALFTVLLRPYF